VWGNTLLGSVYGGSITWGMAVDDPSQTVWGTLDGGARPTGLVLRSP
jgi:hypothetical protein